jgi:hypothetical protein
VTNAFTFLRLLPMADREKDRRNRLGGVLHEYQHAA